MLPISVLTAWAYDGWIAQDWSRDTLIRERTPLACRVTERDPLQSPAQSSGALGAERPQNAVESHRLPRQDLPLRWRPEAHQKHPERVLTKPRSEATQDGHPLDCDPSFRSWAAEIDLTGHAPPAAVRPLPLYVTDARSILLGNGRPGNELTQDIMHGDTYVRSP